MVLHLENEVAVVKTPTIILNNPALAFTFFDIIFCNSCMAIADGTSVIFPHTKVYVTLICAQVNV